MANSNSNFVGSAKHHKTGATKFSPKANRINLEFYREQSLLALHSQSLSKKDKLGLGRPKYSNWFNSRPTSI